MMGFLRRLTGQKAEIPAAMPSLASRLETPVPRAGSENEAAATSAPPTTAPLPPPPAQPGGGEPSGPVFSSRAVRDATVVTGAIEALGRFVAGQDVIGDLIHRLETLTPDQVNFLQLSAEPGLIQRALQRAEVQKGTKASALRKLLGDLASGAIPEADRTDPLLMPKGPILPPLASLKSKQPGPTASAEPAAPPPAAGATPPTPSPPSVLQAPSPPPTGRPAPLGPPPVMPTATTTTATSVAAAVAAAPLPPRPRVPASSNPTSPVRVEPLAAARDEPAKPPASDSNAAPATVNLSPLVASATPEAPPQVSAPPPSVPAVEFPNLPRLARADAESRRARLMAALNDHLSANEAAP